MGFNRAFPVFGVHRHMTVDNARIFIIQTEILQNHIADIVVVAPAVVRVSTLLIGDGVVGKIALERCHNLLAEEG